MSEVNEDISSSKNFKLIILIPNYEWIYSTHFQVKI